MKKLRFMSAITVIAVGFTSCGDVESNTKDFFTELEELNLEQEEQKLKINELSLEFMKYIADASFEEQVEFKHKLPEWQRDNDLDYMRELSELKKEKKKLRKEISKIKEREIEPRLRKLDK